MHRFDAYSSTSYSRTRHNSADSVPTSPKICRMLQPRGSIAPIARGLPNATECYRVYFLQFCTNYDTRFSKYRIEYIVALSSTNATKIAVLVLLKAIDSWEFKWSLGRKTERLLIAKSSDKCPPAGTG